MSEMDGPTLNNSLFAVPMEKKINGMHEYDIKYIERDLSNQELVSLTFLLFGDDDKNRLNVQRRLQNHISGDHQILQIFVEGRQDWRRPMLEALTVVKANKVLQKWGFDVAQLRDIFLPHIPGRTLYINPVLKVLYHLSENLLLKEMRSLVSFVNQKREGDSGSSQDSMFLEILILDWISKCFINVGLRDRYTAKEKANLDIIILYLKEHNFRVLEATIRECVFNFNSNVLVKPTSTPSDRLILSCDSNSNSNPSQRLLNISQKSSTRLPRYKILQKNAGLILIVNQENFTMEQQQDPKLQKLLPDEPLTKRNGTDKDRDAIVNSFTPYGYKHIIIENKDHNFTIQTIKQVVARSKDYHSLIVCILSHGAEGVVYAANSIPIRIRKIEKILSDDALYKKPKMLLIQACRTVGRKHVEEFRKQDEPTSPLACRDMLLLQSTVSYFPSTRHPKTGSRFIQTLCKHIKEYGKSRHIQEIFTVVNHEVSEQSELDTSCLCVVPQERSTLSSFFYLPTE